MKSIRVDESRQEHLFQVTCANGHILHAPKRAEGKSLPCPVCQVMVSVVKELDSMSDTGVLRILNHRIAKIAAEKQLGAEPSNQSV